jgi:hypothetical protein
MLILREGMTLAVRLTKSSRSPVMVFPKRHMKYPRRRSVFIGDDEASVVQQIDGDVYYLTRWDSQKVGDA